MQDRLLKSWSRRALLLSILAVPLFAATGANADDKPIKLKLASVSAPSGQVLDSDGVQWWMDKVTERTKGRVTFETCWGASRAGCSCTSPAIRTRS